MKKLSKFPLLIVSKTSSFYNKAFHAKVFTLFASSESEVYTLAKRFKPHYDFCYSFMCADQGQWFLDINGINRVRVWVLRTARKTIKPLKQLYSAWQNDWDEYIKRSQRLLTYDLSKLSDKEFYSEFKEFYKSYLKVGSIAYIADSFMSTGETDWLEELFKKELKRLKVKDGLVDTVRVLTCPIHLSFTLEEEFELIKLAVLVDRRFSGKLPALKSLAKLEPILYRFICRHQEKFYWIRNNYYHVEFINRNDIYRRIISLVCTARKRHESMAQLAKKKAAELKEFRQRREQVLRRIPLSRYHRNVLEIARLFTKWKDVRKSGVYIGMYHFDKFLSEVARRTDLNRKEVNFLVFDEIKDVLFKKRISMSELKARMQQTFFAVTPKGYYIIGGRQAGPYFKYFMKGTLTANIKEFKGVPASSGAVRGRVHLIRKTDEMRFFKQGEILVTNQTTPEFVPIMKRAAAIITEQGGITSHAAVISRELHKPCIIGTKIATSVLKDGDLVEVDASAGVVRILKKKIN